MMRALYTALFYLLTPFIIFRLFWRSRKLPEYRKRWLERFAYYGDRTFKQNVCWFHAVSVGEAEALFPLLKQIQHNYPEAKLLITTTTPTGSARVKAVMQDSVDHFYLPYDLPIVINRFLNQFRPKLVVVVETEIWPNLFAACDRRQIPLFLINARISKRSVLGYQKISSLIIPAITHIKLIAAQTSDDADRYRSIGASYHQIRILGNIKFDIDIANAVIEQGIAVKKQLFGGRFVWLVASTHKGEESLLLDIYQQLKPEIPELLLVIVPRHPERFDEVKHLCNSQRALNVITRSSGVICVPTTDIYLADTMGELRMLYAAADVTFIGGSLVPVGGHNLLEAAAVGVPILFGPYMANFQVIADQILQRQGAIQCQNPEEIYCSLKTLYADAHLRSQLVERAQDFIKENRGVIDKTIAILAEHL